NHGSRSTFRAIRASLRTPTRGAPLDEAAIREFLARDYPRLVAAVALVSGSRAAAEDSVQEALARAWERSERGERIEHLGAWVLNLVRSGFRRLRVERAARERLAARSVTPQITASAVDLERALATLPRRQREATVFRYYLDMDVREVARVLGIHEGTAKTTLFRGRQALASALGDEEDLEGANDRAGG